MNPKFIQTPDHYPFQAFLSAQLTPGRLLDETVHWAGTADIVVSTFSTAEEFLLKLQRLKRDGYVRSAQLFCDHKAAEKTARILPLVGNVFEKVYFCRNHSKVMIIRGELRTIVVLTSQNQTRGDRLESYVILADSALAQKLESELFSLPTYTPYALSH